LTSVFFFHFPRGGILTACTVRVVGMGALVPVQRIGNWARRYFERRLSSITHPSVVAQGFARWARCSRRVILGVGTGEGPDEVPPGMVGRI